MFQKAGMRFIKWHSPKCTYSFTFSFEKKASSRDIKCKKRFKLYKVSKVYVYIKLVNLESKKK